jgi:ribosomal protein L11 methyltransferase
MDWLEVFVETSIEGLEIVSGLLYGCGITGLMIEDERDFKEFLENPDRDWDYVADELVEEKNKLKTGITFFVTDNMSGLEMLSAIKSGLASLKENEKEFDLGSLEITMKNIKEEDWANNWKKYFKPMPVGDKIMIKPSWEELTEPTDKIVLKIDPGHIFGTGTHETTQCCIEHIENYVKAGDRVLDIGCGSGILGIASLLLGADYADMADIDPNAVKIVTENADMNDIPHEKYEVMAGNILDDEKLYNKYSSKLYDVVEANIVADVIVALSPMVPSFIKDNGIFICSGIIDTRLDDVLKALKENGFEVLETKTRKDWCAVASKFVG